MDKRTYLRKLRKILEDKSVERDEVSQVIDEYDDLYSQGLEDGLTDEQIISKLGDANYVYRLLKNDLQFEKKYGGKAVGLMVFISIIIFFLLGQLWDLWNYAWMSFLLIPITAVLINSKGWYKLPGLSVFLSLIVFIVIGEFYSTWHPTWLVFLSIPISGILVGSDADKKLLGLSPFITLIIYILISYFYNRFYVVGWPVFLLIPIIGSFTINEEKVRYFMLGTLLISVAAYYIIALSIDNWAWPLFVFLLPLTFAIYTKQILIEISLGDFESQTVKFLVVLGTVALYLLVSFIFKGWAWSWLIFFIIPIAAIYAAEKFTNIVAYTPFIAIILFFIIGLSVKGGFKYSWMFFLIIPMTAIVTEKDNASTKSTANNDVANDSNNNN